MTKMTYKMSWTTSINALCYNHSLLKVFRRTKNCN